MYCIYTCALRIVTIGGLRRSHTKLLARELSLLFLFCCFIQFSSTAAFFFLYFFYSFSSLAYLFLRHFSSLSLLAFFFHNILSKRRATWSTARRTITPVTKRNWKHEREHCGIYIYTHIIMFIGTTSSPWALLTYSLSPPWYVIKIEA